MNELEARREALYQKPRVKKPAAVVEAAIEVPEAIVEVRAPGGARLYAHNSSGVTGVAWHEKRGKWRASICQDGKQRNLGYYSSLQGAIDARQAAEDQHPGSRIRRCKAPGAGCAPLGASVQLPSSIA